MPRVHHVKKARKDNPAVKAGEPYYWWEPYRSPKRYSATYPKPSQLCGGKKSEIFAAQENLAEALGKLNFKDAEQASADLMCLADDCATDLRSIGEEYQESVYNLPENLQQGEQAQNMEEMASSLEMAADALEDVEHECTVERDEFTDPDDNYFDVDAYKEACDEWFEGVCQEMIDASEEVEILF